MSWDKLWSDFTQREFRLSLVNEAKKRQKSEMEYKNVSLAGKWKAWKRSRKGSHLQSKTKKDISKCTAIKPSMLRTLITSLTSKTK